MDRVCQMSGCDAAVAFVITWRTRIMAAPAFWYQCPQCMQESVKVLQRDPNMKSVRVCWVARERVYRT